MRPFQRLCEGIFRSINHIAGIKIRGVTFNKFCSADDTVVIANSERGMQVVVDLVKVERQEGT